MSRVQRNIAHNLAFLCQYAREMGEEDFSCFMDCGPEDFASFLDHGNIEVNHLVQINRYFGLPYEAILHRKLNELSPIQFRALLEEDSSSHQGHAASDDIIIPFIPQNATSSYTDQYNDEHSLQNSFPTIKLPESIMSGKSTKALRAFEIEGFSMSPEIAPGDIVIGEKLNNIYNIRDGERYVLVLKDGVVVLKRVYLIKDDSLFQSFRLFSDNPQYDPLDVKGEDIMEIWKSCYLMGVKED